MVLILYVIQQAPGKPPTKSQRQAQEKTSEHIDVSEDDGEEMDDWLIDFEVGQTVFVSNKNAGKFFKAKGRIVKLVGPNCSHSKIEFADSDLPMDTFPNSSLAPLRNKDPPKASGSLKGRAMPKEDRVPPWRVKKEKQEEPKPSSASSSKIVLKPAVQPSQSPQVEARPKGMPKGVSKATFFPSRVATAAKSKPTQRPAGADPNANASDPKKRRR